MDRSHFHNCCTIYREKGGGRRLDQDSGRGIIKSKGVERGSCATFTRGIEGKRWAPLPSLVSRAPRSEDLSQWWIDVSQRGGSSSNGTQRRVGHNSVAAVRRDACIQLYRTIYKRTKKRVVKGEKRVERRPWKGTGRKAFFGARPTRIFPRDATAL